MELDEAIANIALIEIKNRDPNHSPNGFNRCKNCKRLIFDIDTFPDGTCSNCHVEVGI